MSTITIAGRSLTTSRLKLEPADEVAAAFLDYRDDQTERLGWKLPRDVALADFLADLAALVAEAERLEAIVRRGQAERHETVKGEFRELARETSKALAGVGITLERQDDD